MKMSLTGGLRAGVATAALLGMAAVAGPASAAEDLSALKAQIEALQRQLNDLEKKSDASDKALKQEVTKAIDRTTEEQIQKLAREAVGKKDRTINPGRKKVDLRVFGHINQGVLFANTDGNDITRVVDNDNSASRIGFIGQYKANNGWTAEARLELGFELNSTDDIAFESSGELDDEDISDFLSARWAHVKFSNKKFGSLAVGLTEEASQGVSETDLSGTTLIAEADVDDFGGALQFVDEDTGAFLGSGAEVNDLFSNFDGAREFGVAYASPRFQGVQLEASAFQVDGGEDTVAGEEEASINYSFSANYKNTFAGYKVEGAVAYRLDNDSLSDVLIASASTLAPNGINLTAGGGIEFQDGDNDGLSGENENFFFVKLGYRAKLIEAGETRLSVDFFRGQDNTLGDTVTFEQTDAISIGGGVVQVIKDLGTEAFLGARYFDIDAGNGVETDGIIAVLSGARIRF